MGSALEADSLSSVNELAENPPAARGGSRTGRQTLILYIAKVPGSRDIFLTPLKPRERVVSALDIASSLYYFHFEEHAQTSPDGAGSHSDALSGREMQGIEAPASDGEQADAGQMRIPRKPIGPRALPWVDIPTSKTLHGHIETSPPSSRGNVTEGTVFQVIRRDPTSDSQANVGTVSLNHHGHSSRKLGTCSVDIAIDTRGYNKFLSPDGFHRTIGSDQRQIYLDADVTAQDGSSGRLSFKSPWGDGCHFTTGISGRSLKCMYSESNNSVSEFISELKFSLSAASIFGSTRAHSPEKRSKRTSFQEMLFSHHRSHSRESANDPDRMDLSLGRELAGGGFRGKSAKLAKLLIDEHGQEMLDLVVSANIAMFLSLHDPSH